MDKVKAEIIGADIGSGPEIWKDFEHGTFAAYIKPNRQELTLLTYASTQDRGNQTILFAIRDDKIFWGWVNPTDISREVELFLPPKENLTNATDKLLAEGKKDVETALPRICRHFTRRRPLPPEG